MAQQIIGLCGYATAGKDAVAAIMRMASYQRIAFADGVKEEVHAFLSEHKSSWPMDMPGDLQHYLSQVEASDVFSKPTTGDMRKVLQLWGTEYRRAQDPDYWIKRALAKRKNMGRYVFTDVRFPEEVAAIRYLGGEIWRVDRPGLGSDGHVSEDNVASIVPDRILENNLGLWELAGKVAAWVS